ncbi:MAG: septum site-determining protein MinC [Oscillatoriales cyanobacterium SM2_2_1]|nr:septum site-determining protein MinC [Oscillatoriales cyanobacterium SM2_2_1]
MESDLPLLELPRASQTLEQIIDQNSLPQSDLPSPAPVRSIPEVLQAQFKTIQNKLYLFLPSPKEIIDDSGELHVSLTWAELLEQLEQHIIATNRSWQVNTPFYLQAGDRLLDSRQLQELIDALQHHGLLLQGVTTLRRQTAVTAATMGLSVEQGTYLQDLPGMAERTLAADPLYIKMTVRSGTEIRHTGSIVVCGDVNAGAELIADGDVLVWGKMKGLAHAGARGNAQSIIMALHLEAMQVRIADFIARVDPPSTQFCPEVAYVHASGRGMPSIQIVRAIDHSAKHHE